MKHAAAFAILNACLLLTAAAAAGCTDNGGCSLLGKCSGGRCTCFAGWTGASCARADLAPLNTSLGYQNDTWSSWGGRPARDPATGHWHLLATEITNRCPLNFFEYNSQVIRAVSETGPGGPYAKAEVVLPPFHHNPALVGPTPDGHWLLFFIGAANVTGQVDCSGGEPGVPQPSWPNASKQVVPGNGYISMAWTADLARGPWQQRVILRDNGPRDNQTSWHCSEANPSAVVAPNGTVVLVYRSGHCPNPAKGTGGGGQWLGAAVAPHWSGEFVRDESPIIAPGRNPGVNNEDVRETPSLRAACVLSAPSLT